MVSIFYADIRKGLRTFIDCLEFTMGHDELDTDNINEVFASVVARFPELLHPNLKEITQRPWARRNLRCPTGRSE